MKYRQETLVLAEGVASVTKTFRVRATKWSGGWELHIEGEGVTQVRTLDKAEAQVRDYLATLHDTDLSDSPVVVTPELDGLEDDIARVKNEYASAIEAQTKAAESSRRVVRDLRRMGLSVTDTAAALGISHGRVSQLTR